MNVRKQETQISSEYEQTTTNWQKIKPALYEWRSNLV
jgi:hypothetical protein